MSPVARPRVLIAGDRTCEEFAGLLEPEFLVLGTVGEEEGLLSAVAELKPDILVLDLCIPRMDGLAASKRIKKLMRTVRIVYLTATADLDFASKALRGGATGYLPKAAAAAELVMAVRDVLSGKRYISPSMANSAKKPSGKSGGADAGHERLTDRQLEVLRLLAEGRTMKEIAYNLALTPRTVAFHKYMIMERVRVRTNAELIQYAIHEHVITRR